MALSSWKSPMHSRSQRTLSWCVQAHHSGSFRTGNEILLLWKCCKIYLAILKLDVHGSQGIRSCGNWNSSLHWGLTVFEHPTRNCCHSALAVDVVYVLTQTPKKVNYTNSVETYGEQTRLGKWGAQLLHRIGHGFGSYWRHVVVFSCNKLYCR